MLPPVGGPDSTYSVSPVSAGSTTELSVRDAVQQAGDTLGRVIARYRYDMLSHRVHQLSMEAGARWTLNDVVEKPIRTWDSRNHTIRTEYDPLRRPCRIFAAGVEDGNLNRELLIERQVYGEQHPNAQSLNLNGKIY